MQVVEGYKALRVYQMSFHLIMEIFEVTKHLPAEERFLLTTQIRRSSRSVCANIVEAYRVRSYPKHFRLKLNISDGEIHETSFWLELAFRSKYIDQPTFTNLNTKAEAIGAMLASMMNNPEKFAPKK